MERILCAVDFSTPSREALRIAAETARKAHAVLVLAHVEERPQWGREPYKSIGADVLVDAEAKLVAWRDEARKLGAPEVAIKLANGVPWEQIIAIARADPAIGAIIVGTHGHTGIRRALLGSVSEQVVRHAPCTVVVARPREAT